jgi:hypothetical protein
MSRSKQRNDRDNDVELKPRRPGLSLCRYEYDGRPVKCNSKNYSDTRDRVSDWREAAAGSGVLGVLAIP